MWWIAGLFMSAIATVLVGVLNLWIEGDWPTFLEAVVVFGVFYSIWLRD